MRNVLLSLCLICLTASATELKLAFGSRTTPPHSRRFLDFEFVTPDSPRFAPKSALRAWQHIPTPGLVGKRRYDGVWGTLPADTLLEHGIECIDATLNLKLPNGNYNVCLYIGDWFGGISYYNRFHTKTFLAVNGKEIFKETITAQTQREKWLQGEDYVYSAKDSIWDRTVKPILEERTLNTTVTDGVLAIKMENVLLTAIVVTNTHEQMMTLQNKIRTERQRQFKNRFPWKPKPNQPMPAYGNRERQQGFLLFQKYGGEDVMPWTRPTEQELTDCIKVFAARDEQEMMRFGIIPLRPLKQFKVNVGNFKSTDGNIFETDRHADFWQERYREHGPSGNAGIVRSMAQLDPMSCIMLKPRPIDCEIGTPRMYCLDIRVPADATPGDYTAPVTFFEQNRKIGQARLRLKILDLTLKRDDAAKFSFQESVAPIWCDLYGNPTPQDKEKAVKAKILFQSKYGFSSSHLRPSRKFLERFGHITGQLGQQHFTQTPQEADFANRFFSFLRHQGNTPFIALQFFDNAIGYLGWPAKLVSGYHLHWTGIKRPGNSPEHVAKVRKDLIQIIRDIQALFDQNQDRWPKLYWYVSGEPDNGGLPGVQTGVQSAKLVKEAGGLSYAVINGKYARKLFPPVYDFLLANHGTPLSDELVDDVLKHGHVYGSHNTGKSRFAAGWHFWRTRAFHKYQEPVFYLDFKFPRIFLPWGCSDPLMIPDRNIGYRPMLSFLEYRDGMEDYLYVHTLEETIRKLKANKTCSPKQLENIRQAEQFLKVMHDKIQIDIRHYFTSSSSALEAGGSMEKREWTSFSIERLRWHTAKLIMDLNH